MENIDFAVPLKETVEGLRKYIDHLIDYNKLVFAKKMGELSSYLALLVALGFLSTLALIFLSFGFVWWYSGVNQGERYIGFLIVAGFYVFLAFVLYVFRKTFIYKPMRKAFGNALFTDADANDQAFDSSEMLDAKITEAKKTLSLKEKELSGLVEGLGDKYTFTNISKQLFQNAYNSMVKTSNIVKLAFTTIQKIQSRKHKRNLKKEKKQLKNRD